MGALKISFADLSIYNLPKPICGSRPASLYITFCMKLKQLASSKLIPEK